MTTVVANMILVANTTDIPAVTLCYLAGLERFFSFNIKKIPMDTVSTIFTRTVCTINLSRRPKIPSREHRRQISIGQVFGNEYIPSIKHLYYRVKDNDIKFRLKRARRNLGIEFGFTKEVRCTSSIFRKCRG